MSTTFNPSFSFLAVPMFVLEEHISTLQGMCSLVSVSGKTLGVASYYGVEVTARPEINGKKDKVFGQKFSHSGKENGTPRTKESNRYGQGWTSFLGPSGTQKALSSS